MTTHSKIVTVASLALALLFPSASFANSTSTKASSLGSSRNRTAGGSNIVKWSIIANNSMGSARDITNSIYRGGLVGLLANGYRGAVPAQLANETQIYAWKAGQSKVLEARTGVAIANRLNNLISTAERLHAKGEITDGDLANTRQLKVFGDRFLETSQILAQNKVAVQLDQ